MNEHTMSLQSPHFENIRDGKKVIEVRLFDEKRQKIKVGDTIIFKLATNPDQIIKTRVKELLRYDSFKELVSNCSTEEFGADSKESLLQSIYKYYTPEKEKESGVVGIRIVIE